MARTIAAKSVPSISSAQWTGIPVLHTNCMDLTWVLKSIVDHNPLVRMADTKTGASLRPLSQLACTVIQAQPRSGDLVFASRSSGPMIGYRKTWLKIVKLGDLPADITPHVLRHSFASLAADLGYNEPTIASLLGHKTHSITSRYVHSADSVLLGAADAVANATMRLMGPHQVQPR